MCNENRTKYVYPVSRENMIGPLSALFANAARECPRTRFALSVNDILLEIDGNTTSSGLENRYADYQSRQRKDPAFRGDFMPGDTLVMRELDDILTDRYRFKPQLG